ncbi:MAG: spore cortex biosynthesis protein YabQ [Clostridiaceae bacterium]|nr:spore cortex biosynthesis protein YabQ [Clostridiaceae bacterium]MBW4860785.1 spore cortex biosynthesis protein YabQ [Clostridiaceae bacterium]MBW4867410.1 spore cortex biosynthesis protein YabQ [Clostridiaceae bacterium]
MDNSVKMQAYVFFTVFYGGLVVGFIYDVYRGFRYYLNPKKIITFIEDLVFWILATLIVFYILIKSNWGELRGYIFIGLFLGLYLYLKLLSKLIYPILLRFLRLLCLIMKKIIKVIIFPFNLIKKVLSPLFNKVKKAKDISGKIIKDTNKYIRIISKKK